jgi:serine/threonine protein kinase
MSLTADVVHRALSRVGSVLRDRWRLDEVLGVGGMATVYGATHRNKKRVAIKMLHTELSIEENIRARFLREGYLANTVGHPGAVIVLDDDISEDGSAFLVMELLEGETLEMRGERKGKLPAAEVLALTDQLLDVLAAAHEKGIVHRDIKPENLFFTVEGRLKVLDFGIAHLRELPQNTNVTGSGSFLGTPMFMAPEHARARWKEVDAQSDLWSVGATMFMLLSGRGVHVAETVNDQLILAATARAPSIASVVFGLPESVVTLVDRALAYDKAERWPTARAMQGVLRQAASELPPSRSDRVGPTEVPLGDGSSMGLAPELFGEVSERGTLLSKRPETLASSATAVSNGRSVRPDSEPRWRPAMLIAVGTIGLLTLIGMLGVVRVLRHEAPARGALDSSSGAPLKGAPLQPALPDITPLSVETPSQIVPENTADAASRGEASRRGGARPASSRGAGATAHSASAAGSAPLRMPPAGPAASSQPPGTSSPFDRRF